MTRIQFIAFDGRTTAPLEDPSLAQRSLRALGIESGRWALRPDAVSSLPQITYARELLALQHRFGSARVERARQRTGRVPSPEPTGEHDHAEAELRVVLEGRLHYVLRTPGAWTSLRLDAGDWVLLPAGLPHTVVAVGEPRLDMLRLHSAPSSEQVLALAA